MAFVTSSNVASSEVGATGFKRFVTGQTLSADHLNNNTDDQQSPSFSALLAGLLTDPVCTSSGLSVTIPTGTKYYARQVWIATSDTVVSVPDGVTSYIWACSDGQVRTSVTSGPPTGWDYVSSCRVCKVVASGGVITSLDNDDRHFARVVNGQIRKVSEGELMDLFYQNKAVNVKGELDAWHLQGGIVSSENVIPSGENVTINSGSYAVVYDSLTVNGTLTVLGRLKVEPF